MLFLVSVCQLDAIKSILSARLYRVMYLFTNRSNEFKLFIYLVWRGPRRLRSGGSFERRPHVKDSYILKGFPRDRAGPRSGDVFERRPHVKDSYILKGVI